MLIKKIPTALAVEILVVFIYGYQLIKDESEDARFVRGALKQYKKKSSTSHKTKSQIRRLSFSYAQSLGCYGL